MGFGDIFLRSAGWGIFAERSPLVRCAEGARHFWEHIHEGTPGRFPGSSAPKRILELPKYTWEPRG